MKMYLKTICVILVGLMFFGFVIYVVLASLNSEEKLDHVISPVEFIMENGKGLKIQGYETFDAGYTEKNKNLAKKFNITENEAFIIGNLGKYWAKNIIEGKKVRVQNGDLLYYKFGYIMRFEMSAFCIKNGQPTNKIAFYRLIHSVKHGHFIIVDLDNDESYPISRENAEKIKHFVIVRKGSIKNTENTTKISEQIEKTFNPVFDNKNIKIIVSDSTTKLIPDRNCSSDICKEILSNINSAKETIDIAIYGYSSVPAIEKAIDLAQTRGVKVRLVYDIDSKGNNIYPDTSNIVKLIKDNKNDTDSVEVNNTMHNKFYIFDNQIVITGSANLSHTDMSGYNTNAIIVINSPKVAQIYKQEFDQMFSGKFHNEKSSIPNKNDNNIQILFSPQDKIIINHILPLITNSKKNIYISAFVITEKHIVSELIKAKNRGVDIKIIVDALNASTKNSKHKELRSAGIPVKAENYAGKLHSKTIIIDNEYLILGSMNFSYSGENKNDENVIILQNSDASEFYKMFFDYQWNKISDKWLTRTPRAEGKDSVGSCIDGIDNNYDGYIDNQDPACK